jgi:hypothetical protein
MFLVQFDGREYRYVGVPNLCDSKRSAIGRASWRARGLERGTYHQHYR